MAINHKMYLTNKLLEITMILFQGCETLARNHDADRYTIWHTSNLLKEEIPGKANARRG